MKHLKWSVLMLLFVLPAGIINSQQISAPSFTTPEAKVFQKFIDFPVANYTGVPSISLPLFKISLKNFEWPFSLSYHAGGITVNEVASEVGLGWALVGKGLISANYVQGPDFSQINQANDVKRLLNVNSSGGNLLQCTYQDEYDIYLAESATDHLSANYMPDIYYLTMGQTSYKFFLGESQTTGYTMPASPIKIDLYRNYGNSKWTIKDELGNTFRYDSAGGTSSVTSCGFYPSGGGAVFYLTKITTANNEDIEFIYNTSSYSYTADKKQAIFKKVAASTGSVCNTTEFQLPPPENCDEISYVEEKRISRINYPSGYVTFSYSSRADLTGAYKLDEINLYSNSNVLLKTIRFGNSYFGPTSGATVDEKRLKLEKIEEISATDTVRHQFIYNSTELPSRYSFSRDFKNYYNGRSNFSLIPYNAYGPTSYLYADRASDSNYVRACTLEKIIYPTGGNQSFEYGINMNNDGTPNSGLRIRRAILEDHVTGTKIIREYDYASTRGEDPQFFSSQDNYFLSYPNQDMESMGCAELSTCTYLKFSSYSLDDQTYWNNFLFYDTVTEKYSTSGGAGKIVYEYTGIGSFQPVLFDITFIDPQLIRKSIYRNNSGTFELIEKEEFGYKLVKDDTSGFFADSDYDLENRVWGLPVTKVSEELNDEYSNGGWCVSCFPKIFWVGQRRLVSAPFQKIYKKSYQYEGTYTYFDSTAYEYGTDYNSFFVTKEKSINSSNQSLLTQYKYPEHFSGQAVYDTMVLRNMTAVPIESIKTNTTLNKTIGKSKTNFQLWHNNKIIAPQSVEQARGENASEIVQTIHGYDNKGNILSLSKAHDIKLSFIWDYDRNYPIAECKNADTSSIAYTSFEADGSGRWSYYGGSVHPSSPTGEKSYSLSSGSIIKLGLNSGTTYLVTYWRRDSSASVTVNSNSGVAQVSKNGWTLFSHEVTGATSVTVSGTGFIDELRLYPKSASMTTYTYIPFIGISSQCDVNNQITYYQYDQQGRLIIVRDSDKNVIKRICYNYAGQPENCGL